MDQIEFMPGAKQEKNRELADEVKRHQKHFETVAFQIFNDAALIGQVFTKGQEIPETYDRDAIQYLTTAGSRVVWCQHRYRILLCKLPAQ
jgi:hypothetical protein